MKVKVIKSFRDKITKEAIKKGSEIEITDGRFSELIAGPHGVFVEEIKEPPKKEELPEDPTGQLVENELLIDSQKNNAIIGVDLSNGKDMIVNNGEVVEPNEDDGKIDSIAFIKMKKEEIVKYAKEIINIELDMKMTKEDMIKLLLKK